MSIKGLLLIGEFDLIGRMRQRHVMVKFVFLTLAIFAAVSCKQAENSPEMKQVQEKRVRVEALESELKDLKARIALAKVEPPEVLVSELETELEGKNAEIAQLKANLQELVRQEKEARAQLADYQKKYPLK